MTTLVPRIALLASALLLTGAAACANNVAGGASGTGDEKVTLHLGYFPNLTHAPAIYGVEKGTFAKLLGDDVILDAKTFNAGPDVITAIFSGELDIGYVGPNPAINGFQRSKGQALRIIAGATAGGAALVTEPRITSPDQVEGKKIATPQLGNTQDVALRAWLAERGLKSDEQGGGDVGIVNQENAQTLDTFRAGQIDGAWVPEPWATRLVVEGGGRILIDEATLWPDGKYTTTLVIVRAAFLEDHPAIVEGFLRAHLAVLDALAADPQAARRTVNAGIERLTDKPLSGEVLARAWDRLDFTYDPLISTVERSAAAAKSVGLLESDDIDGIANLGALNEVLEATGKQAVNP